MRLRLVLPAKPGGFYERSTAALRKKYPHVDADLAAAFESVVRDASPIPCGKRVAIIPGFHGKLIKLRVESRDQQAGKSGGFRVLLHRVRGEEWLPVVAYAKSRDESLRKDEILKAIMEDAG
jgi:hypothetical protein